jgi:signal recognition particle receptor subunit beta
VVRGAFCPRAHVASATALLAVTFVVFTFFYKWLPRGKVAWSAAGALAAVAVVFWDFARRFFGGLLASSPAFGLFSGALAESSPSWGGSTWRWPSRSTAQRSRRCSTGNRPATGARPAGGARFQELRFLDRTAAGNYVRAVPPLGSGARTAYAGKGWSAMVLFNYSTRELTAKIVYYGPGICGKTTNLQFIHENLPGEVRGKMLSLATKTDRTLFFDFLPIDLGEIRGMKTRVQLYTVPGQVFTTNPARPQGGRWLVFVADSRNDARRKRRVVQESRGELRAGMKLADIPHVIQFNKRDLPSSAIEDMNAALNKYNAPFYESVATTGSACRTRAGAIVKLFLNLTKKYRRVRPNRRRTAPPVAAAPASVARPAPATAGELPVRRRLRPRREARTTIPLPRSKPRPRLTPAPPGAAAPHRR